MTLTDVVLASRIGSEEEAVSVAADFAERFAPEALRREQSGSFPVEEMRELARSGLLAITVPVEFGGIGASLQTVVEVVRLLSVADPSIGQLTLPQFVVAFFIRELGNAEQRQRYFAEILDGKRIGNATQPSRRPGSRPGGTIAHREDPVTILLDGEKYYSTGAVDADYIAVAAVNEDEQAETVLLPGDADGLTVVEDDWDAFGQRSTVSGTVRLEGVRGSVENVLPSQRLFEIPNLFPSIDQIQHAAVDVGIARAALADAAWFVQERANPARESGLERAADDPHLIQRFGQLRTRLDALEALTHHNAGIIDGVVASGARSAEAIDPATVAGNEVKALANDVGTEIASALFELTGTSGTDRRYGLDRHWRNVRTHSVNVANRWRYDLIGKSTLASLGASAPTRAQVAAGEEVLP